jgi:parvulin-like peptidyl-prolyl isomerase
MPVSGSESSTLPPLNGASGFASTPASRMGIPFAPPGIPTTAPPETLEAAQIIARVGNEIILAGEVAGPVDALLEENRDRIPPHQWDAQRRLLIQRSLTRAVEAKLVLVDAKRNIPAEALPNIQEQVNEQFEKEYIRHLVKVAEVKSRAELVAKLAETGSSIEHQRQVYFERSLVSQWLRQKTNQTEPILHEEMYAHYQAHLADYKHPSKVRWEQLTARFGDRISEAEAYQKIARMGNDVLIQGKAFGKVAIEQSDGLTAREGGQRDWTTKGALRSQILDQALFSLPVGQLSTIIKDTDAFHIIRVVEFVPEHRTSFRDAQVEIRKTIEKQRRRKAEKEYYDQLRKEIRVWTVFDDPAASKNFFSAN